MTIPPSEAGSLPATPPSDTDSPTQPIDISAWIERQ